MSLICSGIELSLVKRAVFVLLIVILFFGSIAMMSGTDSKKNEKSIKIFQVSGDKENKINIGVNEKFMLMIRSNITTGYSWSPANIDQIKYLKFLGFNEENCSDKTKGLKGGPSYECLLFQSLLPGKTVIILNLSRPWEKDQEPIKQIKISLMIR